MIAYGAAPADDEVEVSIFGPGYGEAMAVHVGSGSWILVDSCINPDTKQPATSEYLDLIGVAPNKVKVIVASHWHDDHVRGIANLARKYSDAELAISAILSTKEAQVFVSAYSGINSNEQSRGCVELHAFIATRKSFLAAHHKHIIFEDTLEGRRVRVDAMSPLPIAFAEFVARLGAYLPGLGGPIANAPSDLPPNIEALALHVDLDGDALLLCSDLEEHHVYGWSAVVGDAWSARKPAVSLIKVAHHGSATADCRAVWTGLAANQPLGCITPFIRGRVQLPTNTDKTRIRGDTVQTHITSTGSRKPAMDSRLLKRLQDVAKNVSRVDTTFGAVRMRKRVGARMWNVEHFGAAHVL